MNTSDLARYIKAQDSDDAGYQTALSEIKAGRKVSHWIWYIFPQVKGLGHSEMCKTFDIKSADEARNYLADNVLGTRLRKISEALLEHSGKSPETVLGHIDALKVRSSMTLFDYISPNDIFAKVLDVYYNGERCNKTLKILGILN